LISAELKTQAKKIPVSKNIRAATAW